MSRQDYVLIASIIDAARATADAHSMERRLIIAMARRFSAELAARNPRFDAARFMAACGVQS